MRMARMDLMLRTRKVVVVAEVVVEEVEGEVRSPESSKTEPPFRSWEWSGRWPGWLFSQH